MPSPRGAKRCQQSALGHFRQEYGSGDIDESHEYWLRNFCTDAEALPKARKHIKHNAALPFYIYIYSSCDKKTGM
jgi:hypothetical protein